MGSNPIAVRLHREVTYGATKLYVMRFTRVAFILKVARRNPKEKANFKFVL